jgi:alkylation response protein AidB-like acyl-CoA dehydrogenase
MNFELDDAQTMLKDSIRKFLEQQYSAEARRRNIQAGGFSAAHWNSFVEMGWLGASLAEEDGGYGGSAIEAAIILEEFGRALVIEPFLAIGILATQTLIGVGTEQAREMVRTIVSGEKRFVLAHGEADARGAVEYVNTRAERRADTWVLRGTKTLVLGGPFAHQFIISARISGAAGERSGITLFLLPVGAAGVTRRDFRLADGSRASEIHLNNVEVGSGAVLGAIGEGYHALARGYAHATLGVVAEALGAMDVALWSTRDYLRIRRQFGQPIGNFQVLQHRMADMLIELELGRSILYRALSLINTEPDRFAAAVSAAKVQIGKSAHFVASQAIQLHGGIGITEESSIGQYFKRLTFIQNAFGSATEHLQKIAANLQSSASGA